MGASVPLVAPPTCGNPTLPPAPGFSTDFQVGTPDRCKLRVVVCVIKMCVFSSLGRGICVILGWKERRKRMWCADVDVQTLSPFPIP